MSRLQPLKWSLLALALLPLGCASAAGDSFKHSRELFQRAYAQVATAPVAEPAIDSEALRTYPLYSYLQAARIKRALAEATNELGVADQRAETFLAYFERDPV